MSGLDKMNQRLNYRGGNQHGRLIKDKAETLRSILRFNNAYQADVAVMPDGREFGCLINPDKLKDNYDKKIISIPFKDICLNEGRKGKTSQGMIPTNIKAGDVIEWKDNHTFWIVYLQHLEEKAYFRATINRCNTEIEIDGKKYKAYRRGPEETTIQWNFKNGKTFNDLNYGEVLIVTKDETTLDFFHRFAMLKIDGNNWEVQAVDSVSTEGIIHINVKEYFNDKVSDERDEEIKREEEENPVIPPKKDEPQIVGNTEVYPYDEIIYEIKNVTDGRWFVNSNKVEVLQENSSQIKLRIVTGKRGNFTLYYKKENEEDVELNVTILPL